MVLILHQILVCFVFYSLLFCAEFYYYFFLHIILVLDSMGKIPSGLAEGVSTNFGEYDECLDIESDSSENGHQFYGQYCLAKLMIPKDLLNSLVFDYKSLNFTHKTSHEVKDLNSFMHSNVDKIKLILAFNSANFSLFRSGFCVPSTCSALEIGNVINKSK